jgi:hypothetical protein
MDTRVRAYIKLHQFVFLRESTERPGEGTIVIAFDDHRWWWVYAPGVDGVEYYPPVPEHRLVDPLSIRVGERSRDYMGVTHAHKRVRLSQPPATLLAALEQAKKRQEPRIVIYPRWYRAMYFEAKRKLWRAWHGLVRKVRRNEQ